MHTFNLINANLPTRICIICVHWGFVGAKPHRDSSATHTLLALSSPARVCNKPHRSAAAGGIDLYRAAEKEDYATGTTERPTGCISARSFVRSFGPVNVCLCVLWFYEGAPHKAAFDGHWNDRGDGCFCNWNCCFYGDVYHEQQQTTKGSSLKFFRI